MKAPEICLLRSRIKWWSQQCGALTFGIGSIVILGWIADIPFFRTIHPAWVSMKFNTALGFVLGGLSLWLWQIKTQPWGHRFMRSCAFLVLAIGLLTLLQYLFKANLGIDQLLFRDYEPSGHDGRMAPNTALAFSSLGTALILLSVQQLTAAQILAIAAFVISFLGLIGYLLNGSFLYQLGTYTGMAVHTAVAFTVLSLGILFAAPHRGIAAILTSQYAGGVMARQLLMPALLISPFIGWIILFFYYLNLLVLTNGITLFSVLNSIVFASLVLRSATILSQLDHQRQQIGTELNRLNSELEQRVIERTQALTEEIHHRKQVEVALKKAEANYRSIFENAIEGIFQTSKDGYFLNANPSLARIYGYASPEELINCLKDIKHQLYVDPQSRDYFISMLEAHDAIDNFESQIYRKDGNIIWIREHARAIRSLDGELLYYEGIVEDITERKLAEEKLRYEALHDSLTGLPNRTLFLQVLQEQFEQYHHDQQAKFAVLFLDFDRFKIINDSLGHHAGDQFLIIMGQRLRGCFPNGNLIARLGGDEFAILLPNVVNSEEVEQLAQQLQQKLTLPLTCENQEIVSTASIGIVLSEPHYQQAQELLRDADIAMYQSKRMGRGQSQVFKPQMHTQTLTLLQLERELRQAIEQQQLKVYYQSIVCLHSNHLVGFEALVRWQHPQRGLLSPVEFLHLAEETGLIVPIGWWIMRQACQQVVIWQQQVENPLTISVNLSHQQLVEPNLVEAVSGILDQTGLDPQCLKLELTEGVMMANAERAAATLGKLRQMQIQLNVDDFGTGYSSLSRLHELPIDALKIDRSFVKRLDSEHESREIIRATIMLARGLGLEVIAEGIETDQQVSQLRQLGCNYGQGYWFSRPLPADQVTSAFAARFDVS